MELYQLRTFLTVAAEGHLTRAAEKLFTSQPAVSAQLRALEDELGVRLFDRTPKGMILTIAGERLASQAKRVVDATLDFKLEAEGLRGIVAGELILGLNNRPEMLRFLTVLHHLTNQHRQLSYEIVSGSSGVMLQGLDEGSISIAFFEGECTNDRITKHKLTDVDLCLIAPIAWKEELALPDWKKLEAKPWIFMSPMCSYFRAIDRLCQEQGLKLRPRFRVNEELTAFRFVAEGLGMSLVAAHQLENCAYSDKICVLPHFIASVPLSIGYQAARANEPAIRAVRDAVLTAWHLDIGAAETLVPAPVKEVFGTRKKTSLISNKERRKT